MQTQEILLPMWAGYRAGVDDAPSAGKIEVRFHGDRVTPVQKDAVAATQVRAERMKPVLLDAIVRAYPTFRPWNPRPATVTPDALETLVQLWDVTVTRDEHEGVAYVGYMFACAWDPSGIVVVTHGDRVVAAGGLEVLEYPIADPARTAPAPKLLADTQRRALRAAAEKRATKNPKDLRLDRNGETRVWMPAWAGLAAGPRATPSKGDVRVCVQTDEAPVGPAQSAAYRATLDDAVAIQGRILDAIAKSFARLTRHAPSDLRLPKKVDRTALERLVMLVCVHIHDTREKGQAPVGYEMACAWDPEHGLGVLTHRGSVVSVGEGESAFTGQLPAGRPPQSRGRRS